MGLQTLQFYACCRGACCRIRGERRCNALLIHGSASIEPHSMKLIHVQAQTLQTYSTLPRGLLCVYVYVCVCGFVWMCVINDMLFFFSWFVMFCCSLADMGWRAGKGCFSMKALYSFVTLTGQCTYLDQMEQRELDGASSRDDSSVHCSHSLWIIIVTIWGVSSFPHCFV